MKSPPGAKVEQSAALRLALAACKGQAAGPSTSVPTPFDGFCSLAACAAECKPLIGRFLQHC